METTENGSPTKSIPEGISPNIPSGIFYSILSTENNKRDGKTATQNLFGSGWRKNQNRRHPNKNTQKSTKQTETADPQNGSAVSLCCLLLDPVRRNQRQQRIHLVPEERGRCRPFK